MRTPALAIFRTLISVTRAVLVLTCVACSVAGHSRWPCIVGRLGMSIAAAVVPSEKPMSARTSIRALSHGTRRDSLLTAVRTLHDRTGTILHPKNQRGATAGNPMSTIDIKCLTQTRIQFSLFKQKSANSENQSLISC